MCWSFLFFFLPLAYFLVIPGVFVIEILSHFGLGDKVIFRFLINALFFYKQMFKEPSSKGNKIA